MSKLKTAAITDRLASLGSQRWSMHFDGRQRIAAGQDLIELTIGEPDVPTPPHLIEAAHAAMLAGRTGYAGGKGEVSMLEAVAAKYAARTGRPISQANVLSLPGTQAALAFSIMALVEKGDAVLVPDPLYATYEGVVAAAGADFVPVAMNAENGFHLTPQQVEAAITPNCRVLMLNSPHNPTGAVLTAEEIAAIGEVCIKHNLWIISDEVYEQMVYRGSFASPFDNPALADRTIVVSSISKSHAAPGFRAGWCVGPAWLMDQIQSLAEAMLFGNQPFIADMVAHALTAPDDTAVKMSAKYRSRIALLEQAFSATNRVNALIPEAGMFMLVDVTESGMDGETFARKLLDNGVSVIPGSSFGDQAAGFIRLSLTVEDHQLIEAAKRIIATAGG